MSGRSLHPRGYLSMDPDAYTPHPHTRTAAGTHPDPNWELDVDSLFFDDAFRTSPSPSPSPPAPSFLDNLLNPIESGSSRPSQPDTMPAPHAQGRSARLSNGSVDLTNDSPTAAVAPRKTTRESPTSGPSKKRVKRNDGTALKTEDGAAAAVEEIDLSDDQPVQHVLQKQREEAIKAKAQSKPEEEKPTTFNTFNCVICMDTPTDLSATACGHLFCHTCLMEALIAGENRGNPGEQRRSQCPVCRKNINRSKATDIIPLLLKKKGLASQPRKTRPVGPPAATAPKQKPLSKPPVLPRRRSSLRSSTRVPPRGIATRSRHREPRFDDYVPGFGDDDEDEI